ncbi:hypothetical protein [Maridesulfovibrio zosterae]|uniref:hypothetical protein n=1 Tax=Maridesulfovibrio zosterae TaxID=82171 RepID=UPI000481B3F6|nr:hypothetical protein [Maridesulfovibrio zosterae]
MTNLGFNEIIALILVVGATVFPIWLGLRLRRTKPGELWVGCLLCLVFGPIGQVYVEGWLPWFLIVLGVCIGVQQVLPSEPAMLIMVVSSPLVMFFRLRR